MVGDVIDICCADVDGLALNRRDRGGEYEEHSSSELLFDDARIIGS